MICGAVHSSTGGSTNPSKKIMHILVKYRDGHLEAGAPHASRQVGDEIPSGTFRKVPRRARTYEDKSDERDDTIGMCTCEIHPE